MNQDINALSNGDFYVVVENGLTIYVEQEDVIYEALVEEFMAIGGA